MESIPLKSMQDVPEKIIRMSSMELNAALGEEILDAFPETKVDVHNPEILLNVEIRETDLRVLPDYSRTWRNAGGHQWKVLCCCLSGGIDSPVAGYMIAKRGVKIDAVYFHAPPYTSERAKQKVS